MIYKRKTISIFRPHINVANKIRSSINVCCNYNQIKKYKYTNNQIKNIWIQSS